MKGVGILIKFQTAILAESRYAPIKK